MRKSFVKRILGKPGLFCQNWKKTDLRYYRLGDIPKVIVITLITTNIKDT